MPTFDDRQAPQVGSGLPPPRQIDVARGIQGLLDRGVVLKKGASGGDVATLQAALMEIDPKSRDALMPEALTLKFGPATERAVEKLQRDNHLAPDCLVGKRTFEAILTRLSEALEGPRPPK